MDAAELELVRTTVDQAVASRHGRDADDVLQSVGWAEMLAAEPAASIAIVFTGLGRENSSASCLADVVGDALGLPGAAAIVLPAYGSDAPPGQPEDGELAVDGIGLARVAIAAALAVPCDGGTVVSVPATALQIEPVGGVDPTLGLHRVRGRVALAEATARPGALAWDAAADRARLALAHELLGAARAMLRLATEHARERVQFGRPIASFQAVRHKLAEVLVAVEGAQAAADVATDLQSPLSATLAKVLAGEAAGAARMHCQQVLGGIGFTREHEFHRYLLRTMALDGLFGSTAALTRRLGAQVLAAGAVPAVVEL